MPVYQTFTYTWPEGVTPMTWWEWIETLSVEEQLKVRESEKRQHAFRDIAIANGNLAFDNDEARSYIWKDTEAHIINKPNDPEWLEFQFRYHAETQTTIHTNIVEKAN